MQTEKVTCFLSLLLCIVWGQERKKLNMTKQNNSPTTIGESKHDFLSMINIGMSFLMLQKVFLFKYIVVGILQGESFLFESKAS